MTSPDHPTKSGSHRSNLPAVGREVLDDEGFLLPGLNPNPVEIGNVPTFY